MRKILAALILAVLAPLAAHAQNTGLYVMPQQAVSAGANAGWIQGVPINTNLPGVGNCLAYDGTQWSPSSNCGSGGGGGGVTPAPCNGAGNATQFANANSTALATVSVGGICLGVNSVTLPTIYNIPLPLNLGGSIFVQGSVHPQGPEPWIDITMPPYNARATSSDFTTIANCAATNNVVVFQNASQFLIGDGVALSQCGPTATVTAPTTVTVTQAQPTGADVQNRVVTGPTDCATTVQYQVVARDIAGGLSAASPTTISSNPNGSTTTGCTTGASTFTISTMTRTNNLVVVTTTALSDAQVGSSVHIYNSNTSAQFDGSFLVTAVNPSMNQFTVITPIDTRGGNNVQTSETGGVLTVYNGNKVAWGAISNATGYIIYRNGVYAGLSWPGKTYWVDYGTAAQPRAYFVPLNAPSSSQNGYYSTTITAISGNNVTVTPPPTNSTTGSTVLLDAAPAMSAALAAAGGVATVRIPTTAHAQRFWFNTAVVHTGASVVLDAGNLWLVETLTLGNVRWTGIMGGQDIQSPQFSWSPVSAITVASAYPGMNISSQSEVDYMLFDTAGVNQIGLAVNGSFGGSNDSTSLNYDVFRTSPSGDFYGTGLYYDPTSTNATINHSLFSVTGTVYGYTPAEYLLSESGGNIYCDYCYFAGRGMAVDNIQMLSAYPTIRMHGPYIQGARVPLLTIGLANVPRVDVYGGTNDTSTEPIIAFLGTTTAGGTIQNTESPTVFSNSSQFSMLVSGTGQPGFTFVSGGPFSGQNTNSVIDIPSARIGNGIFTPTDPAPLGDRQMNEPFHTASAFNWYFDLPNGSAPACTFTSGGAVPNGAHTYTITAVGFDGGESIGASIVCTSAGANQTANLTWTPVFGAFSYNCYRDGGICHNGRHIGTSTATFTDTNSGTDASCCVPADSGTGLPSLQKTGPAVQGLTFVAPIAGGASISTSSTLIPTAGSAALQSSIPLNAPSITTGNSPPTACGTATGCVASSGASTVAPGQANAGSVRYDLTSESYLCTQNASAEFPCFTTGGTVFHSTAFSGSDVSARINACVTAAIAVTGTCDATSEVATQTATGSIQAGTSGGVKFALLLPPVCTWTFTITNGTDIMDVFAGAYIRANSPAGSPNCVLQSTSGSNSIGYLFWMNHTTSQGYSYVEGLKFSNTGAATTNGVGCYVYNTFDQSELRDFGCYDSVDAVGGLIQDAGFNFRMDNTFWSSRNAGGIPLKFLVSSGQDNDISATTLNVDAPKAGQPNILCSDTFSNTSVYHILHLYEEGSTTDTATTMNQIQGCGAFGVVGARIKRIAAGSTAAAFSMTNSGNGMFTSSDGQITGGAANLATWFVNSNGRTCGTAPGTPCTYLTSAKGFSNGVVTPYVCTSAASPAVCASSEEGAVVIATGATTVVIDTTDAPNDSADVTFKFDSSLGSRLGVTCNTTWQQPYLAGAGAITPQTSMTATIPAVPTGGANPLCLSYQIRKH